MSYRKTDFRALQARRALAMERPELRIEPKPVIDAALVAAAVAAGRLVRIPAKRKGK